MYTFIVTLIKPHYESDPKLLRGGVLQHDKLDSVLETVRHDITACGFALAAFTESPIKGSKGNTEFLAHLRLIP